MKKCLPVFIACFLFLNTHAQTLFTYGNNAVDVKEFLRAYNKNSTQKINDKAKAIQDYLDLYIHSRLKIHEAYAQGYDTMPGLLDEVKNLRAQIVEHYMNDPLVIKKLDEEAFQRSLKDIHVAHIFISARNAAGVTDSNAATKKASDIVQRLQNGEDFLKLAQELSDDPSARNNKGDLGWITVFTLPYEFENIIYSTAPGKYSLPYRSRIGYHIFKNLGERKAVGKIKAQQILLAIPPGADEVSRKQIAKKADSIYRRIMAGENFEKLVAAFSNDYISAASNGMMPDISVGQYDPPFENAVWALAKDGAVSKPVQTSHGYHIVKRISAKPVITDPADRTNQQELHQKVMADSRWKSSRTFINDRVKKNPGLLLQEYDRNAWRAYSDSLLENRPLGAGSNISDGTVLFTIGKSAYTVGDWIQYARSFRFHPDGSGAKPHDQVMEEFINQSLLNYYKDHLEEYNEEFKLQMQEFKDGNLFFEIMQREVWNKAQNDSAALINLYQKNKAKYTWKQSADILIFFAADLNTARAVHEQIKKKPSGWKKIAESHMETLAADSARYEWEQIPGLNKKSPKPGQLTAPSINEMDKTAVFAYIIKVYPQPTQRSYNEARGMVVNDYQDILEKQWIEGLKKKYPVVVDQKLLAEISR